MKQVTTLANGRQITGNFTSGHDNEYLPLYQTAFNELAERIKRFGKQVDNNFVMYDKGVFEDDVEYVYLPNENQIVIKSCGLTTVYSYEASND